MFVSSQERLKSDISAWLDRFGRDRTALMPVLQEIQKKYTHVSPYAMQIIADAVGIHPVEVQSVVSFYAFLDQSPKGRFVIRLCNTISCDMQGKAQVAQQLRNDLGIDFGQTTTDGKFSLDWAACLGMCDQGPALLVNDIIHTRVTAAMVHDILETCRKTFGVYALETKHEEGHA